MNNGMTRYIKKMLVRLFLLPLKILPVRKNRVLLINDMGVNYSCNPKVIAEYLAEHYRNKIEIIYTFRFPERYEHLKDRLVPVKYNSLKYFLYAMTSQVLISNSGGYSYIPLRKKQFVINTHHGGGAYKTMGVDMFKKTYFLFKDIALQAKQTDIFLSTNRKFTEVVSKATLMDSQKFLEVGMPRNDALVRNEVSEKEISSIRSQIGVENGKKLVLYAPTYRKPKDNYYSDSIVAPSHIDYLGVCEALSVRFGGEWVFAYRLHPCIRDTGRDYFPGALNVSYYEDIQDLLLVADVMINDFSSSMWDFMLTGRPSFMYAEDLEHYVATTKVYTPVESWPFPKASNNEELFNNILHFDADNYKEKCKQHYEALGGCETGRATEKVAELVVKYCL